MPDRKIQPSFNKLNKVTLPQIGSGLMGNGRQLAFLNHKNTRVFKIELVLKSGSWYADDYYLVPLTLKMLNEGTLSKTAKAVAEAFDSLGSFIELTPGFDNCGLVVYGLSKYLEDNISLLAEVLFQPAFYGDAFENLKNREAQKLELSLEKSSYLASARHRTNLFGSRHPYGVSPCPEGLKKVEIEQVKNFHQSHFHDFDLLISGNLPQGFEQLLENHFGSQPAKDKASLSAASAITAEPKAKIEVRNAKFVQSSIRMGKILFNRNHEDYVDFMVLNEVLGGYFGSRLMKNIREDKGFTYGIHSQLYALNHAGYFTIGTDVNSDHEERTIEEILLEINRLNTEPIPENELTRVKNYMSGTFAGSLGTPFSMMDKYKAVFYQGLEMSFFDNYIEKINAVSAERLMALAARYLKKEELVLTIVGS